LSFGLSSLRLRLRLAEEPPAPEALAEELTLKLKSNDQFGLNKFCVPFVFS
jgi:hypothetical protein